MPELPEVETIARDLDALLVGRRIESAVVRRPDVLRHISPRALRSRVRGARVLKAWRRGKAVVVDLSSQDRLVIQPRFTGAVLVSGGAETPADPYVAVSFPLADGGAFSYRDVRRLGTLALLDPSGFERFDRALGIEPLDETFSADRLSVFLRSSTQAVKKVLMDQRRIAGVGNIYANEALWLAGIDPSRSACSVPQNDVGNLRDAVVKVLQDAIVARGTTFRDFRDARGEPGGFGGQLIAYGRAGRPCTRCGTRLVGTHAIDGRSTVFCFRCQS